SVALTQMQHDYALTFADASWLISIFYLASAAGQPVMGKLSDMFGAKRLFIAGLVLVAIACLLAPFSVNYGMLLDRKSTRLNSSHVSISYAVFCLKKKNLYA